MFNDLAKSLAAEFKAKWPDAEKMIPSAEIQSIVKAVLRRADLVTREEFDAQAAVLGRTREKLHQLETEVSALEKQLRSE